MTRAMVRLAAAGVFLLAGRAHADAPGLPVFAKDDAHPPVARAIGSINGYSCLLPSNEAAAQSQALAQLSRKAVALGATGIVDLRYKVVKYAPRSPCWRQTYAKAVAVVLQPATSPAK
jgi:hypothetical protein